MVNKVGGLVQLWSGTCAVGETITVAESFANFRFVLFRTNTNITYMTASVVYSKTKSLRATGSYPGTAGIQLLSCRGTANGTSFTLDCIVDLTLTASGITQNTDSTGITEIWGIR